MAVRFKAKAVGVNGTSKTIEIDDSGSFIPPSEEFISLTDAGIRLSYSPSDEHPHAPVIASSLTFELIQDGSNASKINTLIDDIITSEEGRFRVILKDSSDNLEWIGYVMSDQIRRQDRDWADTVSVVRIRAKDGINRLKNIEYVPPSPLPNGRQTILAFLFDVIDDIDHADYFGATDDYLKSIVRWYEANMDGPTINDNPLSFAKVGKDAFRSRDNSGNSVYISSYKVLETICTIFGARFYFSGGCYRFEQIGEYRENGSIYQHRYYKDRTLHTTDSSVDLIVDENNEEFIRAAEGEYSYFAPLRDVELISKHSKNQNYLAGATWSNASSVLENSGTIGTTDTSLFFSGNLTVTPTVDTEFTPPYRYIFKITIKASIGGTDYYLKRDYTYGPGSNVNYTIKQWTTNSADRYYYVTGSQIPNSDYEQVYGIGITTPQLPTDSALAEIEVQVLEHDIVRTSDGTTLAAVSIDWIFNETVLRIANNENPEEVSEETISILINPDFTNVSQELELETLIADGPNLINAAIITTDTGVAFGDVATEEWTKGLTGTGKRIQYLLLEEIMKYRKTSIDQWSGIILDGSSYQYHNLMKLTTNDIHVPLTCEYTLGGKTEQWEGVWYKADYNNTSIDTSGIQDIEVGDLPPAPTPADPVTVPTSNPIVDSFNVGGQIGGIIDDDIIVGDVVTGITIQATGVDGLINDGDIIGLVSSTGSVQTFTVNSDLGPSDTTISVDSTTATDSFGTGSYVTVANSTYVKNVQSATTVSGKVNKYRELFDNVTTTSLTVTENGGTLPANTDFIDVHYNGRLLTEGASYDYQVSGSNINFTFTPRGTVRVMVTFWIID